MNSVTVKQISESFIKPKYEVQEAKQPYYLGPFDIAMLFANYIQKGLLFHKPPTYQHQHFSIHKLIDSLKNSLSITLVHFYPLAGQLVTQVDEARHQSLIFVDCNKGPGARFIHAMLDLSVSDILSPIYVPAVIKSLFDHNRVVNYDGHTRPLLSVQVTELLDGVFIGCSMNHSLGDGTSYWHFWNMWSEIHRANCNDLLVPLSRMPIHKRWFPNGYGPVVHLPFNNPKEGLSPSEAPDLRERIFHFSPESLGRLKSKANEENNTKDMISSFQALSALCWRTIIRALGLPHDHVTKCKIPTNFRHRLDPPLPQESIGNYLGLAIATTKVGELLEHDLRWAASLVHQAVMNQKHKVFHDFVSSWVQSPFIIPIHELSDSFSVHMGSSPRFDMYGNEFGLGKAVAIRCGYANKFVGKVTSYPGYEGKGSVDLEVCLPFEAMKVLESDEEFINAVSMPI
ncbi:unnamed protein product [Amaranthus hypochondriacus]